MDWLVSVHEEETGVHFYRGGAGPDRSSVIEGVIRAGWEIVHREDGSAVGDAGQVVIDGTAVGAIAFGDPASATTSFAARSVSPSTEFGLLPIVERGRSHLCAQHGVAFTPCLPREVASNRRDGNASDEEVL